MRAFKAREIVSESLLEETIIQNWDFDVYKRELKFKNVKIDDLLIVWKDNLLNQCEKFFKKIQANFHDYKCFYKNLDDKDSYLAALLAEIFRNKCISKNCANLDLVSMQNLFLFQIKNRKINFLIAWGHSKRDCGKLKTNGYYADFAELYSISILFLIAKTSNLLTSLPVEVLVLSGGSRFYEALFTNQNETKEYDKERTQIANFLCDGDKNINIKFSPYILEKGYTNKINQTIDKISAHSVANKFNTILCNIDWKNIFINDLSPHGISVPNIIKNIDNLDLLIAASIATILNKNTKNDFKHIINQNILNKTLKFIKKVTNVSTKKYIAIHILNKNVFSIKDYIRLSVHLKPGINNIPAIYMLGFENGNKLSQHCMMVVMNNGKVNFTTNYEAKLCNYLAIIDTSCSGIFNWCKNLPICFIENDKCNIACLIKSIAFLSLK